MIHIFRFKNFSTNKTERAIIFGDKEVVDYVINQTYVSPRGHGY